MKIKTIGILLVLAGVIFVLNAKHFWAGEQMSKSEIEKKWGCGPISEESFRSAIEINRASMACSLIKDQKKYYGKSIYEIRKLFGSPDGFYYKDVYPAYMIQVAKIKGESSWQIVFMLNSKRKVNEIIVHKNCCYD